MYKVVDQRRWDNLVLKHGGHPLQLWAWGELKSENGAWTATRIAVQNGEEVIGGAQILTRKLPPPFRKMFYIPRGPFGDPKYRGEILKNLSGWAQKQGSIELKIEPDWLDDQEFDMGNWRKSKNRVLLAQTIQLDLAKTEDELSASMSKKTRQYIRKSEKDGVEIRRISDKKDLKTILEIYKETAARDKFSLHDDSYYLDLAKLAGSRNQIFLAEKEGRPLAFLWNLVTPANCFELYGGVNGEGQELRANYALKWHAIKKARQSGSTIYDLNGLLNDGISNFKRGFSDRETELVGTWDLSLSPLYFVWEILLPTAKRVTQKLNKRKLSHER